MRSREITLQCPKTTPPNNPKWVNVIYIESEQLLPHYFKSIRINLESTNIKYVEKIIELM